MYRETNVLVLGVGNLLMQDEGIGVHVVHRLEREYRFPEGVQVLDGGTSGMELMEPIANSRYLIVVDAVKNGCPAGTLIRLTGAEVPTFFNNRLSPHQLALSDVLAALRLTGEEPERVTIIGIEPETIELGTELSPALVGEVGALIREVVTELSSMGYPPEPLVGRAGVYVGN